jgi:tetratricopeptide (TPR) repeat protein
MNSSCETKRVQALVDGELDPATARVVRAHLGGCDACQEALDDALSFEVLGAGAAVDRPRSITFELDVAAPVTGKAPSRRPSRRALVVSAGALALAAGLILWLRPDERAPDAGAVFAALARQPRQHEWRVAYAPADTHRRYDGARGRGDRSQALVVDLSAVEKSGDERALAAAQLLVGMERQAQAHLARLPQTADVLNDQAVALLARGELAPALTLLEHALASVPDHPQALWNKALILDRQGHRPEAARLFGALARRGEPGWASEALSRASVEQQ